MPRSHLALLLLAPALVAVAQPVEKPKPHAAVARRVTFVFTGGYQRSQFVAPGEWVPRACYLAMPYREGKVLRFERIDPRGVVSVGGCRVSIDGGPLQPGYITIGRRDADVARLRRALAAGARRLTVICDPERLPLDKLPRLPRGRDLALSVIRPIAPALLAGQPGITGLSLRVKEGHGLDVLGALPDLTSMRLHCPEVCDLEPLAKARKLAWLRLSGVRDLTSLPAMPSLRGLHARPKQPLTDLRPIAGCPRLTVLRVYCKSELTDIRPLAGLRQLEVLTLPGAGITDVTPLAGMSSLRSLDLSRCERLSRLAPLTRLSALEELRLYKCANMVDFSPLAVLRRLQRLDLSGCERLARLDFLAQLHELRELNLGPNDHPLDLAPLAGLTHMESLDLSACTGINDLRPLANLVGLRSLNLNGCGNVVDLSPLVELSKLQEIRLTRCPGITDLSPLRAAARGDARILVDEALKPQLEKLPDETDF